MTIEPTACDKVPVPSLPFRAVLLEYAQPVPSVQPVALPVKVPLVSFSAPNVAVQIERFQELKSFQDVAIREYQLE